MAISNRERVGRMFDLLSPALDEFIQRTVGPYLNGDADWTVLLKLRDESEDRSGHQYDSNDVQLQLRMLTENVTGRLKQGWHPFRDTIGRAGQTFASELREVRNTWAHNGSFSNDDAYRALDTAERLLGLINAPDAADQVRAIKQDLLRLSAEKADRKVLESSVISLESSGLQPWREVLAPHDDVATGNFQAAEFAADLYKVSTGTEASGDYADPVPFFARTYLTEGLQDLLTRAARRLAGDMNASPVINLQTNFGGGKTHSMLAIWHLASGTPTGNYPQDLQELLATVDFNDPPPIHRVALVGNHLATTGSPKPDGTHVNTIWGELAWQLGGAEAFATVATSDANRTPPGEALHELLAKYSPAVILIDEWVAYARTLVGRDDLPAGTFDDQFTFAQALTEAVKGTRGVLLAISIPASETGADSTQPAAGNAEEVGGQNGIEALRRLQNVVRRIAHQWRPASADEAYHIVRQRLFKTPDGVALAAINQTARAFVEMYHKASDEFPREARDGSYEDRIKQTYPIHPELFDRLYQDWSTLDRFQRTRGVLRLMNNVIHALWIGADQSPMIMPGSIPLADSRVNSEIAQYLQDSWKPVIDSDVDGDHAEPVRIDTEKPVFGQRSVTRRLARTVFFGAAPTIGGAHKGLESQRVFLGTAMPGDTLGNFHSALAALADRGTYFYAASGKYWYDLQANISRRAKDQAERVPVAEVYREITDRLNSQRKMPGPFVAIHVCPEDPADIIDTDEARLVVLHPKFAHARGSTDSPAFKFASGAAEHRGTANRTYRNMVVFLAAGADRLSELELSVREYLGWQDVLAHATDLDLTSSQQAQATSRRDAAGETIDKRLLLAYQWALVPKGQPIKLQEAKVEGQAPSLGDRVGRRLGSDGELAVQHAAAAIRHQLNTNAAKLWEPGHVCVGDLWRLYAEYPYMPRLRDRSVLEAGLTGPQLLWEDEGFALADTYDPENSRYLGLVLPTDSVTVNVTDATLVIQPARAKAQRTADLAATQEAAADDTSELTPTPDQDGPSPTTPAASKTRFFGTKQLHTDHSASDFKKILDEVLAPLANTPGVRLSVTVEVEATTLDGFDDAKVRTVSENAATLKFEQSGFEQS